MIDQYFVEKAFFFALLHLDTVAVVEVQAILALLGKCAVNEGLLFDLINLEDFFGKICDLFLVVHDFELGVGNEDNPVD